MSVSEISNDSSSNRYSKSYAYYVLAILWLVALFRMVDLQIIAVLLESIKAEFGFSDTQLGLLSGLAFAIFYSTFGIPLAYLADRYSRKNILSVCLGLWSMMTAICGLATGYVSFFLARMGVGIGEAGGYPPSTSMLSDYFPPEKRGFAFAVLASAIPMGVLFSFLVGGYVNEHYGWRMAYFAVGIPGIILAIIIKISVREPLRGSTDLVKTKVTKEPLKASLSLLWTKKDYCWVIVAAAFATLASVGSGIWVPSFFVRVHGMGSAEVGTWMGLMYGIGGLIGTLAGGVLSEFLSKKFNDSRYYMKVCSVSLLCVLPLAAFVFSSNNLNAALCVHFFVIILMHMYIGPVLAMVQNLAGTARRSMGQAINVLVSNLIGLALGPLIVGFLSDTYTPIYGDIALGYCIFAIYCIGGIIAAISFFIANKNVKDYSVLSIENNA